MSTEFEDEFRAQFEPVVVQVIAKHREDITRPWKRLTWWLLASNGILVVLSILQWVTR